MAVGEFYNEEKIQEQILILQELYDAGELEQEEYEKKRRRAFRKINCRS